VDGVTIRLAGSFGVTIVGQPTLISLVGSRKARRLLMLLAVHRGLTVGIDRIVEALWADDLPRRPERNVATLVSRLRAVLGPDVITGGPAEYRLGVPPAVLVDLDIGARLTAEATRRLAAGEPALAVDAASRVLDLLGTGSLLVGEADVDWVTTARAEAQLLVRQARYAAAAAALLVDDPATAVRVAEAAIAADQFDERAHRLLMSAFDAAGEPAKALTVYERFRAGLAIELGVDPAAQTRALHLAILQERPPAVDFPEPVKHSASGSGRESLLGRDGEVTRLREAWSAAAGATGEVVLIVGEAGIGKTRLTGEAIWVAESTGGLVLQARCYAAERSLFLQPFVDALAGPVATMRPDRLRELSGARAAAFAGLLPGARELFGPPPAVRAMPEVELRRAFEGVTAMLLGLTEQRTVLLVLDDLQNAGQTTVDLLHYLARHVATARLLVLATIRAEEGAATIDAFTEVAGLVELGPLPADAVARLASGAGHGDLAGMIVRRTRGHALFVTEILRGLAAGESGVPESLRTAVLARLRRAGPGTEELLRAGAVLGASVDPAVVAGLLEVPAHVAALRCEQATATRLLVLADRTYEFANDLVQEILYATTPQPTRLAYHRRAADLLTDQPELVATHAAAAQDWTRAARAYLLAGERAAARYGTTDAEALFSRALHAAESGGQLDLVGRAYVSRARVRGMLASYRLAWGDARAGLVAAREAGDRRLEMMALQQLGMDTAVASGVPIADVANTLQQGIDIAEELGDRRTQAVLLARLAINSAHRLQFTEALVSGRRAVRAGRASGEDQALANGLQGLKAAYAYLGDLTSLSEVISELEPLQRRLGDLPALEWAVYESSLPAIGSGDWELARNRICEAIEINRRSEFVAGQAWYVAHLGWLERLQGRTEHAVRSGRQAVTLGRQTAHGWFLPTSMAMLAVTLTEMGQRDEATHLLSEARSLLPPGQPEGLNLQCLAPLAEVTGSLAVLDEADALLRGISGPVGSAWLLGTDCYLAVARAWLDREEPARANTILAPLLAAAERQSWLPALAAGSLTAGRAAYQLGDRAAAGALIGRAITLAARHHMPTVERAAREYQASSRLQ
jgi:DNA-binding SARP family transcriptional activator/tetratricopeptide (TPR) repeat protein